MLSLSTSSHCSRSQLLKDLSLLNSASGQIETSGIVTTLEFNAKTFAMLAHNRLRSADSPRMQHATGLSKVLKKAVQGATYISEINMMQVIPTLHLRDAIMPTEDLVPEARINSMISRARAGRSSGRSFTDVFPDKPHNPEHCRI